MIVEKISVKKSLAVTLALAMGLSLPAGAWAQVINGRVAPVSAAVPVAVSPYAGVLTINTNIALPATTLAPSAAFSNPILAPVAPAAVAVPAAIDAHPVIALIDQIQKAGVSLDSTGTRADAAKMELAANALPEGSAGREQLAQLANVIRAAHPGSIGGDEVGQAQGRAFDGAMKSAAGVAAPVAATGFRSLLARFLPASMSKVVAGQKAGPAPQAEDPKKFELGVNQVRYAPVAEKLPESTDAIPAQEQKVIGQDEALKAIRFGLEMKPDHYNLYVAGAEGSGRAMALRQILSDVAPKLKTPNDLVAATNFDDKDVPVILEFPAGQASTFKQGVAGFVEMLKEKLPAALNSGEVGAQKQEIMGQVQAAMAKSQAEFDAKISAIKLAGKFGLYFNAEPTEEGNAKISIAVTYGGARMTKDEVDQKIASGAFTKAEQEQAMAELQAKTNEILADFKVMNAAKREVYQAVSGAIEKLNEQAVAATVNKYASALSEIATGGPLSPAEEAVAKRAQERNAEINVDLQAFAKEKFGKFGVSIEAGIGENGPVVIATPALGKYPVNDAIAAKLIAAGKITQEEYDLAKTEIAKKAAAIQQKAAELSALSNDEAKAALASKPAPTAAALKVEAYVQSLINYAAENYEIFVADLESGGEGIKPMPGTRPIDPKDFFRVSVLTDNAAAKGAPVVWEANPTYERLFGEADGNQRKMAIPGVGMVKTDGPGGPTFKTGSYVKANGGFLVLNALDVLKSPGVWPALMSAIRTGEAEIADGGFMGMATREGTIYHLPSKVKIVLIGSPMIQMMLSQHDEDFETNFASVAQFQQTIKITEDSVNGYLNFLQHSVARSAGQIMALTRDAMARVLEVATRYAESNRYFTAQFGALHGLLQEATYAAQKAGRTEVRGEDVDAALKAKSDREDVHYARMSELYQNNTFRIDTSGSAVGQINGLAVMGTRGVQMRITFVAGPGQPGLVSVDHQAGTAGPGFVKALGVESSFMMNEFGQKKALKAQYRVSYEQSYGGIDGDSSTSTTIYGILSALSGVPIHQRFAVTGSADQFGNVQPIGGVNQKIEGFFALCNHRGLTGDQGVIIPRTNVGDLVLSPEVAQAIKDGKFHIYAVDTVAQGMEILTGVAYQTIKEKAAARLEEIANSESAPKQK
ncbi:MAG: AAA family ATPase [Elusimicrobiota bacterium]